MTYTPVPVERFGGLNLNDDPQEVGWGGAVDLLNVDFDRRGRLRSRDGYATFTAVAGTSAYTTLAPFYRTTADPQLMVQVSGLGGFKALNNAGAVLATSGAASISGAHYVRFGTPSAEYLYCLHNGVPYRWDGSAFASPTATVDSVAGRAMPLAWMGAVQPNDNRVVVTSLSSGGGPNGASSSMSHVWFSDAGNAESWSSNNYVQLHPGDGEQITALVAWNNLLFAFKESKFFVFYGNSTDSTGNPVFNYRTVNGYGAVAGQGDVAVAGKDGVYFVNREGVFRTTGGNPEKVSAPLDALFKNTLANTTTLGAVGDWIAVAKVAMVDERLYVALPLGTSTANTHMLRFDPANGAWTVWDVAASGIAPFRVNTPDRESLVFTYVSGGNHVGRFDRSYTTDKGTAISSRYQSGFSNLGYPGSEKAIREWAITGSGAPSFAVAVDDGSVGSGATVTLGTAPAVSSGRDRRAVVGRNVGFRLSGTSPWLVSDLVAGVRSVRGFGLS